jgi:two-component system, response regulator
MITKSILLVEDNQSDIELTKRAFERAKLLNPLVIVRDGQEALDYLLCEGPYLDRDRKEMPALVLLDIKLPNKDGLDVLRSIRSNPLTKRLLVVMLTSSIEEKDIADSYNFGANSYIRKPVDFIEFTEVLNAIGLYWLVLNEIPPLHKPLQPDN